MTKASYRDRLRVDLVKSAEEILGKEGLAGLQARRVTQQAKCSVGTLYNVFDGLDGLIVAVNSRTLLALGRALTASLSAAKGNSVEARLMALATAYLNFAVSQRRRWSAVFEHQMSDNSTVPTTYREDQTELFALVEHVLRDVIPNNVDRACASRSLFSSVHGIVALSLDHKLGAFDRSETERQIKFIVSAVARGLTPRES